MQPILDLWAESRSHHAETPDTAEAVRTLLATDPGSLLVAEDGDEIHGALIAAFDGWRGNMYRLAVRSDRRREGIAKRLVEHGEARLRHKGAPKVTALVGRGDTQAEQLWRAAGYRDDVAIGRWSALSRLHGMALEPRDRWARAALGWEQQADWFRRATMPVATWMIDAIQPQPGQTILDLAAGIGDTGFLAAELIEPGGELITADFVPEMLSAAQRRAEKLKITNVRFRQMDANVPLDQPAASLDAVLCRWGYHLLKDGEAALRETRRVLKQDGKVALSAWTAPEDNPWASIPVRILRDRGLIEPDPPGPGQFAWAEEGAVAEHIESAGFVDYRVETVNFAFRFSDVEDWWRHQVQTSTRTADADAQMDSSTRSAVLNDLAAAMPDPTNIPARTWVAEATV